MAALKLRQVQYDLKKTFLRRPVFPMLFGPIDGPLPWGGGGELQGAGGIPRGVQGRIDDGRHPHQTVQCNCQHSLLGAAPVTGSSSEVPGLAVLGTWDSCHTPKPILPHARIAWTSMLHDLASDCPTLRC